MALKNINVGTSANDAGIIRYNAFLKLNRNVTETEARLIALESSFGSNWGYYANNVEYTGVDTSIAAGQVKECTLGVNTLYRFINSTKNANGYPVEDSFYDDFDGVNLTNLIATRGV